LTASAGSSRKQLTKIKELNSILFRSFNTIWPELAIESNAGPVNSAFRPETTQGGHYRGSNGRNFALPLLSAPAKFCCRAQFARKPAAEVGVRYFEHI
jgi:hypothetical protein